MIILGVDPGFSTTGFGIIKRNGQNMAILDYGALTLSAQKTLSERTGIFYDFFKEKIQQHGVQVIALETPFLGKNAQNFLKLGYLRGILYLLAHQHTAMLLEFSPREVKKAITGFGAAEKEQVARVLARLFHGFEIPKKLDVTDALAVTLCGAWKMASSPILQIKR